jgi:1,4-dihydroxy-2-naphthoyl-CoA hydrolase
MLKRGDTRSLFYFRTKSKIELYSVMIPEHIEISDDVRSSVEKLFSEGKPNIGDVLGIEFVKLSKDQVIAKMPVDSRTHQPFGLLHGGASVVLAESICSVGAWLNIDINKNAAVGLEINANHIRAVRSGFVTGVGEPIHRGATTQVWEIKISTESGKLVCVSRCTLAIIKTDGNKTH